MSLCVFIFKNKRNVWWIQHHGGESIIAHWYYKWLSNLKNLTQPLLGLEILSQTVNCRKKGRMRTGMREGSTEEKRSFSPTVPAGGKMGWQPGRQRQWASPLLLNSSVTDLGKHKSSKITAGNISDRREFKSWRRVNMNIVRSCAPRRPSEDLDNLLHSPQQGRNALPFISFIHFM